MGRPVHKQKRFLMGAVFSAIAMSLLAAQEAEAYQIKRVIRNLASFSTNEALSVDLTSPDQLGGVMLDTEKTFVMASAYVPGDNELVNNFMAILDDDHTITFARICVRCYGDLRYHGVW
jgi:hypothetical protein